MSTTALDMAESGWCPYCRKTTIQETNLVHGEQGDVYETKCSKCHHLLRWSLVSIKKKEGQK